MIEEPDWLRGLSDEREARADRTTGDGAVVILMVPQATWNLLREAGRSLGDKSPQEIIAESAALYFEKHGLDPQTGRKRR